VNRPVQSVQEANFYKSGQVTPYGQTLGTLTLDTVWGALKQRTDVAQKQVRWSTYQHVNLTIDQIMESMPDRLHRLALDFD
jgi:xanthine dehydrogenase molybdopterin-binding subunit B